MLKIRLRRMGSTHSPFYRVVVSDSRRTPRASVLEEVGHYNPIADPVEIRIDGERVEYWVGKGAQMSPTVKRLLRRQANPAVAVAPAPVAVAEEEPAAADTEPADEVAEIVEAEAEAAADVGDSESADVEEVAEAEEVAEVAKAVEGESAPETAES
jgi:small subunit ribosomal protein S16